MAVSTREFLNATFKIGDVVQIVNQTSTHIIHNKSHIGDIFAIDHIEFRYIDGLNYPDGHIYFKFKSRPGKNYGYSSHHLKLATEMCLCHPNAIWNDERCFDCVEKICP